MFYFIVCCKYRFNSVFVVNYLYHGIEGIPVCDCTTVFVPVLAQAGASLRVIQLGFYIHFVSAKGPNFQLCVCFFLWKRGNCFLHFVM